MLEEDHYLVLGLKTFEWKSLFSYLLWTVNYFEHVFDDVCVVFEFRMGR